MSPFPYTFPFKFEDFLGRYIDFANIDDLLEFGNIDDSLLITNIPDTLCFTEVTE